MIQVYHIRALALHLILLCLCGDLAVAQSKPTPWKMVRYEDFGAKGDGKTDDFAALVKAHEFANQHRLPVRAKDDAVYRIGGVNLTIPVETDTDFGKARFIIDDTRLARIDASVFHVRSLLKPIALKEVKSLKRNQSKISVSLPGPCLVIAINRNTRQFIRRGNNANTGSAQTDVFLVDARGRVSEKTPIIWEFGQLSSLEALPMDQEILTIKGGIFTTIANQAKSDVEYHARNFLIQRSNVIVEGMTHLIIGEGETGAPYRGFINVSRCANVMVRDSIFSGHKYYIVSKNGKKTPKGTYDLSFNSAVNITLFNCRQSNSIDDRSLWGIMGSNFCKNIVYDRCELSRFDAHQGLTHGIVRNSVIGHGGLRLTGFGTFLLENTTVRSGQLISLRSDYGSNWTGEFMIRNSRLEPTGKRSGSVMLIEASNDGQHDFGYACQMPWRVTIDGLTIHDGEGNSAGGVYLFNDVNPKWKNDGYQQAYPYMLTKELVLRDVKTSSGKPLRVCSNPFLAKFVKVSAK